MAVKLLAETGPFPGDVILSGSDTKECLRLCLGLCLGLERGKMMEVSRATCGFLRSCKNSRGRALGLMRNPTGNFATGGTPQPPSGRSAGYISLAA